ncbi:MAG: hypothetical protein DWP98_11105 [Bacteroidetes bacterium]|nr:MAG: hypothetical protein DWP98_11105 [Bacteroidota bacterium]MBL1143596.1 hypothetical protein [Bacteroidota bacterium]NOG56398.1 T9SS type B sorting domain-containing protein [Bacteroidota bacterium]
MKVINYISIFLTLVSFSALAQEIDRSVIGVTGSEGSNGNTIVTSTIGETVIQTLDNAPYFYTQGFQQPVRIQDLIFYDITVEPASCIGQNNGFARIENITGCSGPYTILWSNGKTGSFNGNLGAGEYFVQITSSDNCTSQNYNFTVGTISNEPCILKFYSGITPNADGINDKWVIDNIEAFPENEVNIFNRLGNRIYKATNYNNNNVVWSGQNLSGGNSPSDTYFFVFEASGVIEKGWIELTR